MAQNFGFYLKKSIPYLFLGGGTATGFAILYPNTVGLDSYRNLVAVHNPNGKEEKVDIEFIKLAEEIKRDFEWAKRTLESTESTTLFTSSSLDITRLGTSKTRWGCQIGIPKYYFEKNLRDEAQMDELLASLEIEPTSDAASEIKQSFNVSRAAKKFALAREMALSKNYQIYFIAAGVQVAVSCFYLFPNLLSSFVPIPGVKLLTFLSLFPLYYIGFVKILKVSDGFINDKADKAAARISETVASGGLEYYDSLLLREKWLEQGQKYSEEVDWKKLFQEIFQKPWNFSFLTVHERRENLKQFMETRAEKQDSLS